MHVNSRAGGKLLLTVFQLYSDILYFLFQGSVLMLHLQLKVHA